MSRSTTRTGSAIGLSAHDVEFSTGHRDDAKMPEQGPTFVGSVVKQESGRLTVMFPTNVPGLDDPRNLWRYIKNVFGLHSRDR